MAYNPRGILSNNIPGGLQEAFRLSPQDQTLQDGILNERFGSNNPARGVSCGVGRLAIKEVPLGQGPVTLEHVEMHGAVELELPLREDGL